MLEPAVIDRIFVLAQIALILGTTVGVVRLIDLAVAAAGRRRAKRQLQRGIRLAARRHAWSEVEELDRQTTRHVW